MVTLSDAATTIASCTIKMIREVRSYCRASDHESMLDDPELPPSLFLMLIAVAHAATPVPNMTSMIRVFQIFDFSLGVAMPVPFSWTWLEWIQTPPFSSTVKNIVANAVRKLNAETLVA